MHLLVGFINFISSANGIFYILAYCIGGIPFGYWYARVFGKIDIRMTGSGSIGATNVLRVLKEKNPSLAKKLAIATLISDALKGLLPILVARYLGFSFEVQWALGILSVFGHCYSPFLKFEGGKGVATTFGVVLAFLPLEALIGFIGWIAIAKGLKISSLASLFGLALGIGSSFLIHPDIPHIQTHAPLIILALIVLYKHIPNLIRLFEGSEKKVL